MRLVVRATALGLVLGLMAAGLAAWAYLGPIIPSLGEEAAPAREGVAEPSTDMARIDTPDEEPDPWPQPPLAGETVPPPGRDVTPLGFTRGPPVTGALTRLPRLDAPRPRRKPEAQTERLFRPIVESAGLIRAGPGTLRLAGIDALAADATCGDGEAEWPCGRMARSQLSRFLRGRAIECEVPRGADSVPDEARCRVAGDDIAEWLVRRGWARPTGPAYREVAAEAEADGRGMWGERP
jgi:endonuclease YncB( thermonuclease family)